MRTTLKLVLPLIVSVAAGCLLFAAYQVHTQRRILRSDLSHRAEILGDTLQDLVEPLVERKPDGSIQGIVERFAQREHLRGVAVYSSGGALLAATSGLAPEFQSQPPAAVRAASIDSGYGEFVRIDQEPLHVYAVPLRREDQIVGILVILHDTSYIDTQISHTLRDSLLNAVIQTLLITLLALVLVRWTFTDPLTQTTKWLRMLRTGQSPTPPVGSQGEIFDQINQEVTHLARDLSVARATAEEEARLRDSHASLWTGQRLRVSVRNKLQNKPLFVVSNREPYMHVFNEEDKSIGVIVPASGVVTALEPVLLACHGTWIAHGSGRGGREVVDARDCLRVPPDHPTYTLRRVWLSSEEERGYYAGFSNEGLWPLCHIAHTRPVFRPEDWFHYQQVNRRFADAVLKEMEGTESPMLLAQDYHFALLPRMIKEARPDARVAIFWHIPWPNAEAFGICPWQRELVDGLLGADLIGFHIQSHCNNFLETVDRVVESRVDWEHFSALRQDHRTQVRPFPISVAFTDEDAAEHSTNPDGFNYLKRSALLRSVGVEAALMGIGVDRVDYTKGILERFLAIERFLEKYPSYQGKFTFVQIGAPSRTHIKRYHDLLAEVEAEADRINWRFQTGKWKPIVFLERQHSHEEIQRFYRVADLCLVTSLHDGMNLVAKEFLAARHDEQGVLILSCFTGAARELPDALLVNPYDIEHTADAIRFALEMDSGDRVARMRRMRKVVREHNIYRWAGNLVAELCDVRLEDPANHKVGQADGVSPPGTSVVSFLSHA